MRNDNILFIPFLVCAQNTAPLKQIRFSHSRVSSVRSSDLHQMSTTHATRSSRCKKKWSTFYYGTRVRDKIRWSLRLSVLLLTKDLGLAKFQIFGETTELSVVFKGETIGHNVKFAKH